MMNLEDFNASCDFRNTPDEWKTRDACREAVRRCPGDFAFVPDGMKTPDMCMEAVSADGLLLKHVPMADRTAELCMAAVKQNGLALRHVPESKQTEALCLEAVLGTPFALGLVPEDWHDAVLKAAQKAPARQEDGVFRRPYVLPENVCLSYALCACDGLRRTEYGALQTGWRGETRMYFCGDGRLEAVERREPVTRRCMEGGQMVERPVPGQWTPWRRDIDISAAKAMFSDFAASPEGAAFLKGPVCARAEA